jgi:flagellar M-ring protein FliF
MTDFLQFLRSLSGRSRVALGSGFVLILVLVVVTAWWALRTPYGVLFSNLSEADAAAIVQELDKLKQPYQVTGESGQSQTLLVPQEAVHKTRMALMGRQMPLHGAVGFELFNNTEFGVSDFVQKVNYQRALQGELTRTILALEQVQSARIHLALPDQGLFRKEAGKAKASVTLVMRPGATLGGSQVAGIQRLIAASVPDIRVDDVTVTDQHGVTLSRAVAEDGAGAAATLDAGVDVESRLVRKATLVLERMFGAGQALVTVDVVLNHQQTRVTTEEVLAATHGSTDQAPAGVVVKERTTTRQAPAGEGATGVGGGKVTSQEIDYQAGKRVMQVVSPSGAVARLNVAVVIKRPLSDAEVQRVRELVSAAVGVQASRGDVIALYAVTPSRIDVHAEPAAAVALPITGPVTEPVEAAPSSIPDVPAAKKWWVALAGALFLLALLGVWLTVRSPTPQAAEARNLSQGEREALLKSVHQWLGTSESRA